jgi:hypothetical protein
MDAYYYGQSLIWAFQKAQAWEPIPKFVIVKSQEFWEWDTLADRFEDRQDKMRACYCKALMLPTRIHRQCHRKLERLLQLMGMAQEATIESAEVLSFKGIMRG